MDVSKGSNRRAIALMALEQRLGLDVLPSVLAETWAALTACSVTHLACKPCFHLTGFFLPSLSVAILLGSTGWSGGFRFQWCFTFLFRVVCGCGGGGGGGGLAIPPGSPCIVYCLAL